jgi:predicted transcriptional regulator
VVQVGTMKKPLGAPERHNIRLDATLAARCQRIAEADRRRISDVYRLAIEAGLDELEARLGIVKRKP